MDYTVEAKALETVEALKSKRIVCVIRYDYLKVSMTFPCSANITASIRMAKFAVSFWSIVME